MTWKNNVMQSFDTKSAYYDKNCNIQKIIAQSLAADFPDADGCLDILEIGCGTGNLTAHLLDKYKGSNFRITDVSASMIDQAKGKFSDENICWSVMDGENPDKSSTYDLIVSSMSFQWFEDINKTVESLCSMLNPKGVLLYSMPGNNSFLEWKQVLKGLELPLGIIDFPRSSNIYRDEVIMHQYDDALDFLRSMKNIGAGTAKKNYVPLNHAELKRACGALDQNHGAEITWHVLYGRVDN
ncbi:MAG: methyltransferase [Alphaproteobacteria bacterium]